MAGGKLKNYKNGDDWAHRRGVCKVREWIVNVFLYLVYESG